MKDNGVDYDLYKIENDNIQLRDDFEKLKEYVEYLAQEVNKNISYTDYLGNNLSDINDIIFKKELIFMYLDKIDVSVLEQYIRKRKIDNLC